MAPLMGIQCVLWGENYNLDVNFFTIDNAC
jgi:hypothetical protein